MLRIWPVTWFEELPQAKPIELGNGQVISVEDALEGHFQRLETAKRTVQGMTISAEERLDAAIEAVAPHLTPLTGLANEVAAATPIAQPNESFRETLHKALEETHRQHQAHRILGIRQEQSSHGFSQQILFTSVFILTALLVGWLVHRRKQQRVLSH